VISKVTTLDGEALRLPPRKQSNEVWTAPPEPSDAPLCRVEAVAPTLEIRRGSAGLVRFCGEDVRLTPRQFRLLDLLARAGADGVPYERLERWVWPDAVVERQQIGFHKRRLEDRLLAVEGAVGPLIETVSCWGLRLLIPKERVLFEESEPERLLRRRLLPWLNSIASQTAVLL
jgi:DNA-binding winged helix-turn-helix (wHTH) protein